MRALPFELGGFPAPPAATLSARWRSLARATRRAVAQARGKCLTGEGWLRVAESAAAETAAASPPLPVVGVTEIRVDVAPAELSDGVLCAAAAQIGATAQAIHWIAPVGTHAAGIALRGMRISCPRTSRESTWAIEQVLVGVQAPIVAAWLPAAAAEKNCFEQRLLRRLRTLARQHGARVVLFRAQARPAHDDARCLVS